MIPVEMQTTPSQSVPADSSWVHVNIAAQLPALRRFALRLVGPRGDADDLVQETVIRALAAAQQFKPDTALKSWLFTIMRNTFCTAYQKQKREVIGVDDSFSGRLSMPAPQEWAIRRRELYKAIARLPARSRQPLLLVSFGTSYDEAARICGCEVGTIKSRVNRARKQLNNELGTATVN